jgi:hypothetical protein
MNFVDRFRFILLSSLIVVGLLTVAGCGQFFPSSTSITALSVAPPNSTVAPGVTQQYTATATYGNNSTGDVTSSVTWSATPTSVATISGTGLLTGVALGTASVKAQSGSVIGTTGVTVGNKPISSLSIAPLTQTLSLSAGTAAVVQFTATATYKDNTTGPVTNVSTWTSTPSSVATISSTGLATAVSVGAANVTATSSGVTSNTATITVVQ